MKTLCVSDLDGTLLGPDGRLSAESARLLNGAIAQGALFTVATARTPATVDVLLRDVTMRLPAIVFTGAAMWDFAARKYTDVRYIRPDRARSVLDVFRRSGVTPFVYTLCPDRDNILHVYYESQRPSEVDQRFVDQRSRLALKRFHIGQPLLDSLLGLVILFFASGAANDIAAVARSLHDACDCSVSTYDDIYNPGIALIEVFAPGVSKAAAINELRARMKADRVVVFGDNLNDLAMFRVADHAVAVANALPEVRALADDVIGPNTDDVVPRYILEHL